MVEYVIFGGFAFGLSCVLYKSWQIYTEANKSINANLEYMNTEIRYLKTNMREFENHPVFHLTHTVKRTESELAVLNKNQINDSTYVMNRINELNRQLNALQNSINTIQPIISYCRAKNAASKSSGVHRSNMDRVAETKKEATDLLK